VLTVPASELALTHLGRPVPSAALLGGFAAMTGLVALGSVTAAIEGSAGVAETVARCRPEVICAYPISPQTHIVEALSRRVKSDKLAPCEFINVESEFAAMSVAIGASAAGARAYTATASQGLLYMTEPLYNASGLGPPIVMTVANRAIGAPINIWNDHSDAMSQRDCGWIQLYAETNQEAMDLHIQAFRIAQQVSLPVMARAAALEKAPLPGFSSRARYPRRPWPSIRSSPTAFSRTSDRRRASIRLHGARKPRPGRGTRATSGSAVFTLVPSSCTERRTTSSILGTPASSRTGSAGLSWSFSRRSVTSPTGRIPAASPPHWPTSCSIAAPSPATQGPFVMAAGSFGLFIWQ